MKAFIIAVIGPCFILVDLGCAVSGPAGGGSGVTDPCDVPGAICTVAGTGAAGFNGDGKQALETMLYSPLDVCFEASGMPLILDWNNVRVRRINEDGTMQTIMGQDFEASPVDGALATETALHHASDIEMDGFGRLYVAGDHAPVVFRVEADNRVFTVAGNGDYGYEGDGGPALEAKLGAPYGVIPIGDGGFYVSDYDLHVVRHVDGHGTIATAVGTGEPGYTGDEGLGPEATVFQPTRLRLNFRGDLYICDTGNNVIRRLDTNEIIHTFAGTGATGFSGDSGPAAEAQLSSPLDIRFSAKGNTYIADAGNNRIRRVDAAGIITTVVGTGASGFSGDGGDCQLCELDTPASVTFDVTGAMWIADMGNHRVRRVAGFLGLYD